MPLPYYRRPHSALSNPTHYDLSTKNYRIPQPQSLNKIKSDIYHTFSLKQSATYTDIMQLTKDSSKYHNKIDRLCSKYCIKPTQTSTTSLNVDSQFIAKHFVRRKSKQKQSVQRKNYINVEIRQQANRVRVSSKKIKTEDFFKLTCENLKKLQKRENQEKRSKNRDNENDNSKQKIRRNNSSQSSSRYSSSHSEKGNKKQVQFHPYLKIYQQSQSQALKSILNTNNQSVRISNKDTYPQLSEAEEWQKYQKSLKDIYSGIQKMRYAHSAREVGKMKEAAKNGMGEEKSGRENDIGESFYIT